MAQKCTNTSTSDICVICVSHEYAEDHDLLQKNTPKWDQRSINWANDASDHGIFVYNLNLDNFFINYNAGADTTEGDKTYHNLKNDEIYTITASKLGSKSDLIVTVTCEYQEPDFVITMRREEGNKNAFINLCRHLRYYVLKEPNKHNNENENENEKNNSQGGRRKSRRTCRTKSRRGKSRRMRR